MYSGRVKKVGKLSVARQGLDLLIIVDHGGWVERGGLLHDSINLGKLSTEIVRPACNVNDWGVTHMTTTSITFTKYNNSIHS